VEYANPAKDMGIFSDLLWQQLPFSSGDWLAEPYSHALVRDRDRVGVRLQRTGSRGSLRWVTIHKTFWLRDDSSRIVADYEYENHPDAMENITICPWFHNGLAVKGQDCAMYLPAPEGVREIPHDPVRPVNESFHYDATAGWFGMVSPGSTGAFFSMAYPQLMAFYNWQGTSGNSMEWMLRSQTIPYGKSFKTSVSLCAFAGMPRLDGAKGALAGAFTRVNGELSGIKLYAAEGFSGTLTVSVRKHPALLKMTAATFDLALAAGSTTTRGLAHPVQGDGTFAVVATVRRASGEEALQFEVPVVRGDTAVPYAMPPESNRLGSDQERFGKLIKNASDTVDPYEYSAKIPSEGRTKWCKPYAGGTIKLLALAHMHVAREVIEISERMDVDLRTCTFFTVGKGPWNATWGHNGGHAEINAYFAKAMAEDYDVILIAAPDLKYLAKENIALLAKKVRSGTGLVTTMPRQIPDSCKDLFPALPLIETSYKTADPAIRSVKTYAPGEDAGFATALPLAGLPEIHVYPYAPKPDSNVLVTADGAPLIVCGTAGKGRSAVLTWLVGQPTNTSFGGVNPHFLEDPAYPWHEYYYAMVIKAVRWAANREPAVALSAVEVRPGALRLSLSSSLKAAHRAKVEIVIRHESGRQIARFVRETTVAPGSTTVDLKTAYAPMAGRNFADVR
ncbi:MAG: hypothetical protein HN904_26160, partial [Victivallales bacterium]|nr:hypothetical protein [Victivallales bacterium]